VYDKIIVGGGSAGSVVAHRLSARSANAACIMARRTGSSIDPAVTFPTIEDGFAGVAMVERGRRSLDGDGAVNAELTS
jgi:5-(hydroxymethyl)furfural/furfural oxidase